MLSRRAGAKQGRCGPRKHWDASWQDFEKDLEYRHRAAEGVSPKSVKAHRGSWKTFTRDKATVHKEPYWQAEHTGFSRRTAEPLSRTASSSTYQCRSDTYAKEHEAPTERKSSEFGEDGYASASPSTTASGPFSASGPSSASSSFAMSDLPRLDMISTELQTCLPNATIRLNQPVAEHSFWLNHDQRNEEAACAEETLMSLHGRWSKGFVNGDEHLGHIASVHEPINGMHHFSTAENWYDHALSPHAMMSMRLTAVPPPPPPLEMLPMELATPLLLNSFLPPPCAPSYIPGCFSSMFQETFAGASASDIEEFLRSSQPEAYED